MKLLEYCIEILRDSGQITLPSFGKFELVFESVKTDPKTGKIFPPRYLVNFSQQHNLNDNSLTQDIAYLEAKSDSEIQKQINQTLSEWKHILKNEGHLHLNGLGVFTAEKEKILFQTDDNCTFNFKFFGLPVL